jgi:hypothetical protein
MFFPAADTIAFSEGGVESMRLNSSGVLVTTNDASISGLTVGKGAGAVSTNTALGGDALVANTTGATNTAIGNEALKANTTASNNTAVGYQAGLNNVTGENNLFVGMNAGNATQSGNNTLVGRSAGESVSSGGFNTLIGNLAGADITTGAKNTVLGRYNGNQGGLDIRTASGNIVLSNGDGDVRYANLELGDVSTAAVDIGAAVGVAGLYFISGFNAAGGAQGWFLIGYRSGSITTISSANGTGLTVNFSEAGNKLRIATSSGTIKCVATQITDVGF